MVTFPLSSTARFMSDDLEESVDAFEEYIRTYTANLDPVDSCLVVYNDLLEITAFMFAFSRPGNAHNRQATYVYIPVDCSVLMRTSVHLYAMQKIKGKGKTEQYVTWLCPDRYVLIGSENFKR